MYLLNLSIYLVVILWVGFSQAEPQCRRINETISGILVAIYPLNTEVKCGYNYTARFNFSRHFSRSLERVIYIKSDLKNCSAFVDVMACSLFLPRCTEEIKGPYLPCRGVCYDYANGCKDVLEQTGLEWTAAYCDLLPEKDNPKTTKGYKDRCFTPPNYRDSGRKYKHRCFDIVIPVCQGIPGFNKTVVATNEQREKAFWLRSLIYRNSNESDRCIALRKEMFCVDYLMPCVNGGLGYICRDRCLNFSTCRTPFSFSSDMCMEFPRRESTPIQSAICSITHWPRALNWQIPENPLTPTSGQPTQNSPAISTTHTRTVVHSTAGSKAKGPANVQARKGGKISAGAITGIVLGLLAGLAVIAAVVVLWRRYNRYNSTKRQHGPSLMMDQDMDEL